MEILWLLIYFSNFPTPAPPGGRSLWFKVILIDWESFDDILMYFNDQIREKTWWVNARKMLIRKDSTENQSVGLKCMLCYKIFSYSET